MNQFNFILEQFGLQNVKPKLYKPGSSLKSGHTDMSGDTKTALSEIDYNMTTLENGVAPLSMLGTPVFCDMILKTKADVFSIHMLWCLVEVNMTKNIVKTAVQGRDGTVKEYIALGDYQVQIRGGLVSPFSYAYPKAEVQNLIALCNWKDSLKVVSEFLQMFGIYELVIEDYSIPQREGVQNIQLFDLKCVSDQPIQLKKK